MSFDDTRGYTLSRIFDAPRDLAWQCWTNPLNVEVWFGGHEGRMEDVEVHAEVGGAWGGTMVLPDGHRLSWTGKFLQVEEPTRLVVAFSDADTLGEDYDTFTVNFTDLGGKTEMSVRQAGGHRSEAEYSQAQHGLASFFDVMAELLSTLQQ